MDQEVAVILTLNDYFLGPQDVDLSDVEVIVSDIDGTIADLAHRRRWILSKPKNWEAFEKTIHLDTPIAETIEFLQKAAEYGVFIIYASGRGAQSRNITLDWLGSNSLPEGPLYMRAKKDYRADDIIKREILEQIRGDGYEPDLVLDDRQRVVDMWRKAGVYTIQVDEGDF